MKIWILGFFCIVEISFGVVVIVDYDGDGFMDIYYVCMDGLD